MGPQAARSQWRQATIDGESVYVASYPQEQVVVLTMDDHYARLSPNEARAHARHILQAADYTEMGKR